jgi:lipopolysaccharide transport system permease protein
LTVVIFSFFFGRVMKPDVTIPYPVFVFSGLLLWQLFSGSINASGSNMLSNATIIKKIYFPRIIIPISAVLVSCIDFIISFIVLVIFLIYYQISMDFLSLLIFWPSAILLTLVASIGLSCLLSGLIVKYKDFRYVIPFGLQIGLFLSPVIYPVTTNAPGWASPILALNPMVGAIALFRLPFEGMQLGMTELWMSIGSAICCFIGGILYFNKTEAYFADIA